MPDANERERTFTRRYLLRSGAFTAGVAWSIPVVQSVRVLQDAGSRPPASTTPTTPAEPTSLRFEGSFRVTRSDVDSSDPSCIRLLFDADTDLISIPSGSDVNPGSFQFNVCFGFLDATDGSLALALPGGSLTCTLESGSFFPGIRPGFPPGNSTLSVGFVVTGGTGEYSGASGSVFVFARWPSQQPLTEGTVSANITLANASVLSLGSEAAQPAHNNGASTGNQSA
jgi:hypothetical protein